MNLRYLWRSVASVLVLSFALCPTLCYATEMETNTTTESAISNDGVMFMSISPDEITSGYLQTITALEGNYSVSGSYYGSFIGSWLSYVPPFSQIMTNSSFDANNFWSNSKECIFVSYDFKSVDGTSLVDKGDIFDLSIGGLAVYYQNGYTWSIANVGGGSTYYGEYFDPSQIESIHLYTCATSSFDWANTNAYDVTDSLIINGNTFGIDASGIEAVDDIKYLRFRFAFNDSADDLDSSNTHTGFIGWTSNGEYQLNYIDSTLTIEVQDENTGLLKGIIEWLKSIRNGITSVGESIIQLPNKIWTVMENGIKGLFVPTDADITKMHDDWDNLMRERFGAIYEAGDIAHEFGQTLQTQSAMAIDSGGIIQMPAVTVNFAGTPFTFGGYDVDIIPSGFENLHNAVKSIVNIVCTVLFINMLRNKLEELIR